MNGLMDAVELRLCDADYRETRIIDQFSKFTYTDIFCGKSTFELDIDRRADFAGEITIGRVLHMHDLLTDKTVALIVKQINVSEDDIKILGNEYAADLFSVRLCLVGTDSGDGYDTISDCTESVMRHFIAGNITESTISQRQDSILRLETAQNRGETITISARFETLLDVLTSCVSAGGNTLGWEAVVVPDDDSERGWYLEWRCVETTDRTQTQTDTSPVVLSEEFCTAKITDFCSTLPDVNYCIAASAGEAENRTQTHIGLETLSGIMRRESFIDARDASDSDEIEQRANEAIAGALATSIELEYLDNAQCRYGLDFRLGDTITADAGAYGTYDLQVTTASTTWEREKKSISLTIGTEIYDVVKMIRDVYRAIPDRRK